MKIITVASCKGGCGKTTTALNLAACYGWEGHPVLLLDLDPQGHATLGTALDCRDDPGLYEVFARRMDLEDVVIPDVVAGIDLVPATRTLGQAEALLADWPREKELALRLGPLAGAYRYAVLDCPPSLGLLTTNALLAADLVLIPVEMSLFGLDSVERLLAHMARLEARYETAIPFRVLPTMVDQRTRLARAFLRELWARYPEQVLPVLVHHTVRLREAACRGLPIIDYDADSAAAHDYRRLARLLAAEPAPRAAEELPAHAAEAVPA